MTFFIIGTITVFILLVIFEINRLANSMKADLEKKRNGQRR